jgi:hypothetical protein
MIPESFFFTCRGCGQLVRIVKSSDSLAALLRDCPNCDGTEFECIATGRVVESVDW